jgi:hypothetical protein
VPTPFYHLSVGKDLLGSSALSAPVRAFLQEQSGAFLFGSTAPDVQVISGQNRAATHFFDLPVRAGDFQPWDVMLARYPELCLVRQLGEAHAAFLAGYLCHLLADWTWVREIFIPVFGPASTWGSFRERLYLHNVLRSYLDLRLLPGLGNGLGASLEAVTPDNWLPFTADQHLVAWRELLTPQFRPGAQVLTVEVFSARQGIPVANYYALLNSEQRMQSDIFSHLNLESIESYRQNLLVESSRLLENYLAPRV